MTTNNLIGYDPLAWMDGDVSEEPPPVEIAKKATKSRAKVKVAPVEIPDEPAAISGEIVEDEPTAELKIVDDEHYDIESVDSVLEENEEVEVSVKIDEEGEIEIVVETDKHVEIAVEISIEKPEVDNTVIDEIVEEITEMATEKTGIKAVATESEDVSEPLIELNPDSTMKHIMALYATIKEALAAHDTIEINASDVTTIDTATLQLLVSLKKYAPQLHKTIDIIYPSKRFIESAKLLNLLDVLEIPQT